MKTSSQTVQSYFKIYLNALLMLLFVTDAQADIAMINKVLKQNVQLSGFDICYGGGCAKQAHASMDVDEWQRILDVFDPLPSNAEDERDAIAIAVGVFEEVVGLKTGTDSDRAGTFGNSDYQGQQDCNDEATNTTTYLKLMSDAGLLQFYQVVDLKTRHFFYNGWPHTTAVIEDKENKQNYAVDSWFYDNGIPPEIIPLDVWLDGWKPNKTAAH